MISIITAYYNRKTLFINTLISIKKQLINLTEIEVIAVDDASENDERLEDIIPEFPFLKIIRLEKENKWYRNSCIPFNIGFKEAKGDIIIFQNPECLHFGNILSYTIENLTEKNYLSFGCYSLSEEPTNTITSLIKTPDKITEHINNHNSIVLGDGQDGWYNHSIHRPVGYHFCCAITRNNLYDLGGFDERYALGVAYDDDEFLHRVKLKGLKVKIIDDVIVLHQNHYDRIAALNNEKKLTENQKKIRLELLERNKILLENVTKFNYSWRVGVLHPYKSKKSFKKKFLGKKFHKLFKIPY